ncbi:MAG: lytic transglycosylase domain-containing protein [Muribaculaceae bacterium]|nr:lytic transglycosylase domain-containing protein [Muribaculaceae bacterium]
MKKILLRSILTIVLVFLGLNLSAQTTEKEWNTLIRAMIQCESKGNPKAKNGPYVGVLQISKICVRGVNQIGVKKFSYNDRLSREKSIEMFNIFNDKYNPDHDIEKAIRMWSGGVRYSVKRTQKNYNKVIAVYKRMLAEENEAESAEPEKVDEQQPAAVEDAEPAGEE